MTAQAILTKAGRMDAAELAWRGRTVARRALDRTKSACAPPSWRRERLGGLLIDRAELDSVHRHLARGNWLAAHNELSRFVRRAPQRFAIAPANRPSVAARVRHECPTAAEEAARRADRIMLGEYDLLGYEGLRF